MSPAELHALLVHIEIGLAALTFVALLFVVAPYGKHASEGWGPSVPATVGWVVMETPAVVVFLGVFVLGARRGDVVPLIFGGLWLLHYVNRAYVYPLRARGSGRRIPLVVAAAAFAFCSLNGYINARWVSHLGAYGLDWLRDPRFVVGALLFSVGWGINLHSDAVLRRLRQPGESGYKIPRGGLFRWVSSPNYLGEILEWTGWALATWSTAGLAFALYAAANLGPRAVSTHRWYRERFDDYPAERRALIPFVL